MSKTPRYTVMIKRNGRDVHCVSVHHALGAAGKMLGSYISGKRRPTDLEWAFVRDQHCPGENTPWSSATLSRNQIKRVAY